MKIYHEDELKSYFRMEKVFCTLMTILFVCGCLANVFVLKCVLKDAFRSSCTRESGSRRRRRDPKSTPRHVYVYIGALLVSDLLLLINCPFIIHDVTNNGWYFDSIPCKFLFGNESFHKVLTGCLLAALSFDQLITVRKILSSKWRTVSTAVSAIGCCAVIDIVLQIPLFIYTDVQAWRRDEFEEHDVNDSDTVGELLRNSSNVSSDMIIARKCLFNPPPDMEVLSKAFNICIFVVGFCIPTLIILVSYCTIIDRMVASGYFRAVSIRRRHNGASIVLRHKSGSNGCRLITWYVSLLVLIYLCCWAPYWILTGFQAGLIGNGGAANGEIDTITYVMLYFHLLPYVNATLNPFAYGYLVQCCAFKKRDGIGEGRSAPNCIIAFCYKRGVFGRDSMALAEYSKGWSREETWARQTATPKNRIRNTTALNSE